MTTLFTIDPDTGVTERWDDEARVFTRTDPDGVMLESRPFHEGEIPLEDTRAAAKVKAQNEATLREQARVSIDTLLASIEALKTIYSKANSEIGPNDTKNVARETRRVARQLVTITRIVVRALDSTSTGSDE